MADVIIEMLLFGFIGALLLGLPFALLVWATVKGAESRAGLVEVFCLWQKRHKHAPHARAGMTELDRTMRFNSEVLTPCTRGAGVTRQRVG